MHDLSDNSAGSVILAACTAAVIAGYFVLKIRLTREKRCRQRLNYFTNKAMAGNCMYRPINVQLGVQLYEIANAIQNDKGALAQSLQPQRAIHMTVGTDTELVACRNLDKLRISVLTFS